MIMPAGRFGLGEFAKVVDTSLAHLWRDITYGGTYRRPIRILVVLQRYRCDNRDCSINGCVVTHRISSATSI